MKNYLLLLLTLTTFITTHAQLSNKHWLPPLHAADDSVVEDHHLYISTAIAIPFQVTVTTGNGVPILGSPFTISQANPVEIEIGISQNSAMFLDVNNVNIIKNDKGLILEGPEDFYVSFRMRSQNHAETLISKGIPGIGTSFRLGSTPQGGDIFIRNFVSSVMATEDNTTVTLSDYNTNVEFVSGAGNITADSQTFILNTGESIIFSGYTNVIDNWTGFIGALLTASKPVAVSTGNATGGVSANGSDFTLDQIVSSSQIGDEYIFIEGNGLPEMESPLIIADEDNTEIFVNGNTTAAITLNAGDYYLVPNSEYQGTINRNIYVKSSRNVYAYQLIGGDFSSPTSGLNFIPPLSCFFQKSVYLPSIDEIGSSNYSADLMILTYSNATITINGTPINVTQSQTVLGNTDWVTYRISGYSGNVNVVSTGPLAVGIFGFSGNAGYAGYYSGFGSIPKDTNVVVCTSTTSDLFEEIIGNPEPGGVWELPVGGAPLTGNGNIFDPAVNSVGEYVYVFTKICNSSSAPFRIKVTVSTEQAGNPGTNTPKSTCKNAVVFDMFPLLGTGVTTGGTWSFNGTNRLNDDFNPATDVTGDYIYTLAATTDCPELKATITVTNYDIPTLPTTAISDLKTCDDLLDGNDTNGQTTFTLNTTLRNNEILNGQTGVIVTFHLLEADAKNDLNAITSYTGANRIIFARLENTTTTCYNTTSFNLVVTPLPVIDNDVEYKQCDINTDRIANINLREVEEKIVTGDTTLYNFRYFTNPTDAANNTNAISNDLLITPNDRVYNVNQTSTVWARVENQNGCSRISQVNLTVSATQLPATFQKIVLKQCDDFIDNIAPIADEPDNDGIDFFDLNEATDNPTTGILAQFTNPANLVVTYYVSYADAEAKFPKIDTDNPDGYRNTVPNLQSLWVRIDSKDNNDCVGLGQYVDLKVNPLPDFDIIDYKVLCVEPGTGAGNFPINATPITAGNYTYVWTPTNPETTAGKENAIFNANETGIYKVLVTNDDTTCFREDETELFISSAPQVVQVQLVSEIFASGLSTIQAVVIGGYGDYEYSLDGIEWQDSPVFSNLENATYTIIARDKYGCGDKTSKEIVAISFPNYFTPNADSYNDTWNIKGLTTTFEAKIFIYDRYGKLLKQIDPYADGWDGKYNGKDVPSTDYWFKIEYKEEGVQKQFKSHFSLKR